MKKQSQKHFFKLFLLLLFLCAAWVHAEEPSIPGVTGVTLKVVNNSTLNLSWKSVPQADGYVVWFSEGSEDNYEVLTIINDPKETSGNISHLLPGLSFYAKIQTYAEGEDDSMILGPVSAAASATISPIRQKCASKSKHAVIYWEQASAATGYEIYRSSSKSGKYSLVKKTTSAKTLSWTDKNTKAGKKYYYKVRPYILTSDGTIYYGGFSKPTAFTVTKTDKDVTVAPSKLQKYSNLKRGCSSSQFLAAYKKAKSIVTPLMFLSKEEQLYGIATELRKMLDSGKVKYSTSAAHYNDPYGYFVKGVASCAGCTRATGLCLNMLGISYEHVNENQWKHQWCRVKVGSKYWICDAYGLYVGPEPAKRKHPYL